MRENEEEVRLETLQRYHIIDTAAEQAFDNLTQLASSILDMPISLLTLIDEDRQWFKSRVGVQANETPREIAFCNETIKQPDPLVVDDALVDARFSSNPLVMGTPFIRFYAGIPLAMPNGARIGTLCVIDTRPRNLDGEAVRQLQLLADTAVQLIRVRRKAEVAEAAGSILPICAWCSSIKEDEQWKPMDEFLGRQPNVSHSICPGCMEKGFGGDNG